MGWGGDSQACLPPLTSPPHSSPAWLSWWLPIDLSSPSVSATASVPLDLLTARALLGRELVHHPNLSAHAGGLRPGLFHQAPYQGYVDVFLSGAVLRSVNQWKRLGGSGLIPLFSPRPRHRRCRQLLASARCHIPTWSGRRHLHRDCQALRRAVVPDALSPPLVPTA